MYGKSQRRSPNSVCVLWVNKTTNQPIYFKKMLVCSRIPYRRQQCPSTQHESVPPLLAAPALDMQSEVHGQPAHAAKHRPGAYAWLLAWVSGSLCTRGRLVACISSSTCSLTLTEAEPRANSTCAGHADWAPSPPRPRPGRY